MSDEKKKVPFRLLSQIIASPPKDENKKYIFLLPFGAKQRTQAVQRCGFWAIQIEKAKDKDKRTECDEDARNCTRILGTALLNNKNCFNYVFVIACFDQDALLRDFFKENGFKYRDDGWKLFQKLPKDNSDDTRRIIDDRIKAFVALSEAQQEEASRNINLNQFHLLDRNGNPRAPFDYAIAEHIKKNYDLFVMDGRPYLYKQGSYISDENGTALKKVIKSYLYPEFIKSRYINAIFALLLEDSDLQRSNDAINLYDNTWICFLDCMLDVQTMETHSHDPKYFCINQIPYKFADIIASEKCDAFKKFFNFAVPDEADQLMFLQYAGLCLTKDSRWQKILIVTGTGGCGKSTLLKMIDFETGERNHSAVALQSLSQRFATSSLFLKLVNICADLKNEALEDTSIVKQLSGEDLIFAEHKGQTAFSFRSYAKQIYSCNSLPLMKGERNNGIFRRLLILEMNNVPDTDDVTLESRLKRDLLGFMKISIEALHKMYVDNKICESENSKRAVHRLANDSDTVSAWLDECCELDKKSRVERTALYDSYSDYCSSEERQSLSKTKFFATLRSRGLQETKSSGIRGFAGIKITGQISVENCPESALGVPQNCPEKGFLSVDDGQVAVPFDKTGQK